MSKMLKPCKQWICDTCGEVIQSPKEGWLEWLTSKDDGHRLAHSFKIVHHKGYSPNRFEMDGCYQFGDRHYNIAKGQFDLGNHLECYIDPNGLMALINIMTYGSSDNPDPRCEGKIGVRDIKEMTEIIRRIHLPYYEEARIFAEEVADYTEHILYRSPKELKEYIKEHKRGV